MTRALLGASLATICACKVDQECNSTQDIGGGGDGGGSTTSGTLTVPDGGVPPICHLDECDPAADDAAKKAACDDGDSATADRCAETKCGGACVHVRVECDGLDSDAEQQERCDDGDPCTADRCEVSACAHSWLKGCGSTCAADEDCDDGETATEDFCGFDYPGAAHGECLHFAAGQPPP